MKIWWSFKHEARDLVANASRSLCMHQCLEPRKIFVTERWNCQYQWVQLGKMRRKVVGVGLSDGGARNGIERALYARQGKHHMLTQSKRNWPGCLTVRA